MKAATMPLNSYTFTLPRAFSANRLHTHRPKSRDPITGTVRGGKVRTEDYRAWLEASKRHMIAQGPRPQFTVPVCISLTIGARQKYGDTPRWIPDNFDGDNCWKSLMDLMVQMGVLQDDGWRCVPMRNDTFDIGAIGLAVIVTPLGSRFVGRGGNLRVEKI